MHVPVKIEELDGRGYRATAPEPFDVSAEAPTRELVLETIRGCSASAWSPVPILCLWTWVLGRILGCKSMECLRTTHHSISFSKRSAITVQRLTARIENGDLVGP